MAGLGDYDPDHALAILLQARFNEELKKEPKRKDIEKENLPVQKNIPATFKSSLIDPEWETTDPCPDIHGLFVSFNERFFWGRLLGVEVKWSPQMTSCAGICVYEGRNGLCSVRLSAPLLKLRPRSDLVETLLHEMIHAFLFVTDNNRDREGHGPEFHKHMHRINKEAGTNITVYHSFHAEVRLYQQHWWRCNGPCQSRPPFFGMVKRARNRAPGPNDRWWADHHAACGGEFVKVREPEEYKKKGSKADKDKPKNGKDIREFFKNPYKASGSASATITSSKSKVGSNIFGFHNVSNRTATSSSTNGSPGSNGVNRVVGFKNISSSNNVPSMSKGKLGNRIGGGNVLGRGISKPNNPSGNRPNNSGKSGRGGMLSNRGGGTLVVTGSQGKTKPDEMPQSPNTKLRINTFKVFSGSGFTLGGGSTEIDRSKSRLLNLGQDGPKEKRQKIDGNSSTNGNVKVSTNDGNNRMCSCSVCGEQVLREEVDMHLEICVGLQNVFDNSTVDVTEDSDIIDVNVTKEVVPCPICNVNIQGDINSHLDECLNTSGILNLVDDSLIEVSDSNLSPSLSVAAPESELYNVENDVLLIEPEDRVACFVCGLRFGQSKINDHVNQCLDSS